MSSFSGHRGRRRATIRRSPFAFVRRRARGQAPARPLAASMHSTMASRSRTRQRFGEGRIGASDGEVVEQKNGSPLGIGRMSSKRDCLRKAKMDWAISTWDLGHGVRDGDLTWDLAGGLTDHRCCKYST